MRPGAAASPTPTCSVALYGKAIPPTTEVHLASARLETTPEFRVLERRALFPATTYFNSTPHSNYDISPDGSTFAFVRRNPASRIVVIQNMPALVRRAENEPSPNAR